MALPEHCRELISLELAFMLAALTLLIRDLTTLNKNSSGHIDQLDTFESLANSVIDCSDKSIGANLTDNDKHAGQESLGKLEGSYQPLCPIDLDRLRYLDDLELDRWLDYRHIEIGGHFEPIGCRARQRVAIVVPYRHDQHEVLEKFLLYIHQFLPDQLIHYIVFVVDQADDKPFNPTRLYKVGVDYIRPRYPEICCFIFHTVNLIPLDQRNLYMCTNGPRQLSARVSNLRYQLSSPKMLNGVVAMTRANHDVMYGSYNKRDEETGREFDTYERAVVSGLKVVRTPVQFGVYIKINDAALPSGGDPKPRTGNSISDDESRIVDVELKLLYTHIKCKT